MNEPREAFPDPLQVQLRAVPVCNPAVEALEMPGGRLRVTVPRSYRWWERPLRWLFLLSDKKHLELDAVGASVFLLMDGRRTLEEIIDAHKDRWKLSFFESRGLVLTFLHRIMRRHLVRVEAPGACRDGDVPAAGQ